MNIPEFLKLLPKMLLDKEEMVPFQTLVKVLTSGQAMVDDVIDEARYAEEMGQLPVIATDDVVTMANRMLANIAALTVIIGRLYQKHGIDTSFDVEKAKAEIAAQPKGPTSFEHNALCLPRTALSGKKTEKMD